jgi:hypothetical protein
MLGPKVAMAFAARGLEVGGEGVEEGKGGAVGSSLFFHTVEGSWQGK